MPSTLGIVASGKPSISIPPGELVLNTSMLIVDSVNLSGQLIPNSGTATGLLTAQLGSTSGVDTNDPTVNLDGTLSFTGAQYLVVHDDAVLNVGSFTVTIMYRSNTPPSINYPAVVSRIRADYGYPGWAILEKPAGNTGISWAYFASGTSSEKVVSVPSHHDSLWYVRTIVFDVDAARMYFYDNGVSVGTPTNTASDANYNAPGYDIMVHGTVAGGYVGDIDFRMLAMKDYAASPTDILNEATYLLTLVD